MFPGALTVTRGGGQICLLSERAAFLPEHGMLLVADAHLGKSQSFRRLGVPVPSGTTRDNLLRLGGLIERTGARTVAFLGDLVHAARGCSPATQAAIGQWRQTYASTTMVLVRGNHDPLQVDFGRWGIDVVDEPWRIGPWALCHHPQPVPEAYVLCGHVHPGVVIGRGIDRLRLPCFHLGPVMGLLPAFGSFTGMHTVRPDEGAIVAVVAEDRVRLLPAAQRTRPTERQP